MLRNMFSRSSAPVFSNEEYEKVEDKDKIEYLAGKLDEILAFFGRRESEAGLWQSGMSSLEEFGVALANKFELIEPSQLEKVLRFLIIAYDELQKIPLAEKYFMIFGFAVDGIVNAHRNSNDRLFSSVLRYLFLDEQFCKKISSSDDIMKETYARFARVSNTSRFRPILEHMNGTVFVDAFVTGETTDVMATILSVIMDEACDPENKNELVICFARFLCNVQIKKSSIVRELVECGAFDPVNELLIDSESEEVVRFYRALTYVHDKGAYIDSTVVKLINAYYRSEKIPSSSKIEIMVFLGAHQQWIAQMAEHSEFEIERWIVPDVFDDDELFDLFTKFVSKCTVTAVADATLIMIHEIVPPRRENVLYDAVFQWIAGWMNEGASEERDTVGQILFDLLFQKPDMQSVLDYFHEFTYVRDVLVSLMKIVSGTFFTDEHLTKVTEIMYVLRDEKEYVDPLIGMFCGVINVFTVSFMIRNLENEDIKWLTGIVFKEVPGQVVNLVKVCGLLSALEGKMRISQENAICVLEGISILVQLTNDRFFDDWVIRQPKESPVFSVPRERLPPLVFSASSIIIPSLIPFCEVFDAYSAYSRYLIGAYAIPVYMKLSITIPDGYIKNALVQFMRVDDFKYFLEAFPARLAWYMSSVSETYEAIECRTNNRPAWVTVDESFAFLSFKAMIYDVPEGSHPFLVFSEMSLSVCGDELVDPSGAVVACLACHKWHTIAILLDKRGDRLSVFVGKQLVYKTKERCGDFVSIGSEHETAGFHFVVAILGVISKSRNVTELMAMEASDAVGQKFLNHGHAIFVPHHSYRKILAGKLPMNWILRCMFRVDKGCEFDALVSIFCTAIRCAESDSEGRLKRLRAVVVQNIGKWNPQLFQEVIGLVASLPNSCGRNVIFNAFLFDFGLLCGSQPEALTEMIRMTCDLMTCSLSSFNFDFLCRERALYACFMYIHLYSGLDAQKEFLRLATIIAMNANQELVQEEIGKHLLCVTINAEKLKEEYIKERQTLFIKNTLDIEGSGRSEICRLALHLEEKRGMKIMSLHTRLFMAMVCAEDIGLLIIRTVMPLCISDEFAVKYLVLLSVIVRRLAGYEEIWLILFRLLTNNPTFTFEKYGKHNTVHQPMLFLIFCISARLFECGEEALRLKVSAACITIIAPKMTAAGLSNSVHALYTFVRRGEILWSSIIPDAPLNPIFSSKKEFKDRYLEFLSACKSQYERRVVTGDDYLEFVSIFMCNVMERAINDYRDMLEVQSVLQYAHVDLFFAIMIRFLWSAREMTIGQRRLDVISACVNYLLVYYAEKINSHQLSVELFRFCAFDETRYPYFFHFWLLALSRMNDGQFVITLELLKRIMLVRKKFDDYCAVYCSFLDRELPPDHHHWVDFWTIMRTSVKSTDKFSYRQMRGVLAFESYQALASGDKDVLDRTQTLFRNARSSIVVFIEKRYQKRIQAVPDRPSSILNFVFPVACRSAVISTNMIRVFVGDLNNYYRKTEDIHARFICAESVDRSHRKTIASLAEMNGKIILSPFHDSDSVPVVLIRTPSARLSQHKTVHRNFTLSLLGMEQSSLFSAFEPPAESVAELFSWSAGFACESTAHSFKRTFGKNTHLSNCLLSRNTMNVQSVVGVGSGELYIIVGACLANGDIVLESVDVPLLESILCGDFGSFGLFRGHPVIVLTLSSVLFASRRKSNVYIISLKNGAFWLSVGDDILNLFKMADVRQVQHAVVESWLANATSNAMFLFSLNILAGRTPENASMHPIFPRIFRHLNGSAYEDDFGELRNMALPIGIAMDPDQEHKGIKRRMNEHGYHHRENALAPDVVLALLRRITGVPLPGQDQPDWEERVRTYVSNIEKSELPAEMFLCPEIYENADDSQEQEFDVKLPTWARNSREFVELHRFALESKEVRSCLNDWIDLIFGYKQSGAKAAEAMNMYNPRGYLSAIQEDKYKRNEWVALHGAVPERIMSKPCQKFEKGTSVSVLDLQFIMNPPEKPIAELDTTRRVMRIDTFVCCDNQLSVAIDLSITERQRFAVVTFRTSIVIVYRIIDSHGKKTVEKLSNLLRSNTRFSILSDRQLVCATACDTEVVIWSIANSVIVNIIDVAGVDFMVFDDENNMLYVAGQNMVKQYTINGQFMREIKLSKIITAMTLIRIGFQFDQSVIVVGTGEGSVIMIGTDFISRQLTVLKERALSDLPILRLFAPQRQGLCVHVFDMNVI